MRKLIIIVCTLLWALSAFAADGLDSLLKSQRERAGDYAVEVFSVLEHSDKYNLTADEVADLRFLLAYLPLSDFAAMNADALVENVRLAREGSRSFSWNAQITDELYRHFILPHRVSQEPFVRGWRSRFMTDLTPRVKNLSMTDAALEVNHWCHEQVTYKPDDSRDQDPLTSMRAGLGRCEEEMIFAISALRSVGIPARQCYTPYWAHQDDNHAWVEVWTDGKWHYFGACEPEPALDKGWFSEAATRTMLVVSTAYGDYHGSEPVLKRYGSSTLINSSHVYGVTRELEVTLTDHRGKPLAGEKVIFNLFNYGGLMPAASLETGKDGKVKLTCGQGDWFVSAGKGKYAALVRASKTDNQITLKLEKVSQLAKIKELDYIPPTETPLPNSLAQDSLFRCRMATEDSLRASSWGIWEVEAGLSTVKRSFKPDSVTIVTFAQANKLDGAQLFGILEQAKGNWGNLVRFLTGNYPKTDLMIASSYTTDELQTRFVLLNMLSEKDCRDFSPVVLEDHFNKNTLGRSLSEKDAWTYLSGLDSASRDRYEQYVIAPRIKYEPSLAWRGDLSVFLQGHPALTPIPNDKALQKWLKENITVEEKPDRLGPPMTPLQTLTLHRGSGLDLDVLYAGICRVRGIPARFNPVSDRLERWDAREWQVVTLKTEKKEKPAPTTKGTLSVECISADTTIKNAHYYKDWSVGLWSKDHLSELDLGYLTSYKDIKWPQDVPTGLYCLTTGFRQKDGSAKVSLTWFDVKPRKPATILFGFRAK